MFKAEFHEDKILKSNFENPAYITDLQVGASGTELRIADLNYNIFVAKGMIVDAYCNWLFPILFRIEEIVDPEGIRKPNRYMGYIGETLDTLYFMYHGRRLQTAHTGCRFLT